MVGWCSMGTFNDPWYVSGQQWIVTEQSHASLCIILHRFLTCSILHFYIFLSFLFAESFESCLLLWQIVPHVQQLFFRKILTTTWRFQHPTHDSCAPKHYEQLPGDAAPLATKNIFPVLLSSDESISSISEISLSDSKDNRLFSSHAWKVKPLDIKCAALPSHFKNRNIAENNKRTNNWQTCIYK